MPFPNESFDVVHGNSVIEHLGSREDQLRMANEVRRVGRGYWVQTPAVSFPLEPHFLAPVIHWLPRPLRKKLLPITPWALITHPSREYVDAVLNEIRLLKRHEVQELFPDATVERERLLGVTKSWIAVRQVRPSLLGDPAGQTKENSERKMPR